MYGNTEEYEHDVETSEDAQRTDDTGSTETAQESRERERRALRYKANGRLYEDDLPEGLEINTPEAEAWLKDRSAGWRGKREEKGHNDPGYLRDAVAEGVREGMKDSKPKDASVDDDPYSLMTKSQRKQYETLLSEGTEDDRFQFLVEMGIENRKAHYEVYKENKALKDYVQNMMQVEGAAREMRMIHKIDPDFPDPDIEPESAWDELNKDNGYRSEEHTV